MASKDIGKLGIEDKGISLAARTGAASFERRIYGDSEMRDLNTYRTFDTFLLPISKLVSNDDTKDDPDPKVRGIRSIFSNINALAAGDTARFSINAPLLDTPEGRRAMRIEHDCTINNLVKLSREGKMGRKYYDYSDFAYCKHLGKVSNNYLITLRRFPTPCGDHIDYIDRYDEDEKKNTQDHNADIGRMVTWMGVSGNDMSKILSYSTSITYDKQTAEEKEYSEDGDKNDSPLGKLFAAMDGSYAKQVQQGRAGTLFNKSIEKTYGLPYVGKALSTATDGGDPPYTDLNRWRDETKVYGPLDVIMETYRRGRGLGFEQKISLVFEYELRSYNGINGKAAMLDLLGNILATCHLAATGFWGGCYRNTGAHQSEIFANLPIFNAAAQGRINSWDSLTDSVTESFSYIGSKLGSPMDVIKSVVSNLGQMLLGGMLNKLGRPQKAALNSLLTDAPVGNWHLCIGNPQSPIMEMGNLILTKCNIEHTGPLGYDDFPTGLKVTVELEHGKPRANQEIERMYTKGDARIYTPMGEEVMRMYENAEPVGTNSTQSVSDALKKSNAPDAVQISVSPTDASGGTISNSDNAGGNTSVLQRYFGYDNEQKVVIGSKEAYLGSSRKKASSSK